jgi:hypothetical protein
MKQGLQCSMLRMRKGSVLPLRMHAVGRVA